MLLKNSRVRQVGSGKFSLDAHLGAVQMRDPIAGWLDIKPRLVRQDGLWVLTGAPYAAEIDDDGGRRIFPDRADAAQYLHLPSTPLMKKFPVTEVRSSPSVIDGEELPNIIVRATPWGEMVFIFTHTGVHFQVLFNRAPTAAEWAGQAERLEFDTDATLDIAKMLGGKSGRAIPRPRLVETGGMEKKGEVPNQRYLDWQYVAGKLRLDLDFSGMKFPVLLRNATIDEYVDAGADDGYGRQDGSTFDNAANTVYAGNLGGNAFRCFARFDDIAGLGGSTITVAYLSAYVVTGGDANTFVKMKFEDAGNPAAIADAADWATRVWLAGAGEQLDFDGAIPTGIYVNGPSAVIPIQTLADSYDPSAIQASMDDDGSAANSFYEFRSYDFGPGTVPPLLHIEYSVAGARSPSMAAKMIAGKMI